MSAKAIEFITEKKKVRWLKWLAGELRKTKRNFPTLIPLEGEYPDWVLRVERDFAGSLIPVYKVINPDAMTPKTMGNVLGNTCALTVWIVELINEGVQKLEVEAKNSIDEPNLKIEKLQANERLDKWYLSMCRLAKSALRSSVDQGYTVMSEFLLGFANGFARKPQKLKISEVGNTNCEIYIFLLMFWRYVELLKSVHELHQVLVKCFGHRAGDLKRTEKMCQRIGLHYRKPGRPKKNQTIQTPA